MCAASSAILQNGHAFFLAEYLYERAQSPEGYREAWAMLRALSGEVHDWATNHCLALTVEIGEQPGDGVLSRATANNQAVFGLHGAGCWYAINGKPDQAIKYADQLAGLESVDAIILAVEVARLAKRPDVAKRYVERSIDRIHRTEYSTSSRCDQEHIFEFYASESLSDGDLECPNRDNSCRTSKHRSNKIDSARGR